MSTHTLIYNPDDGYNAHYKDGFLLRAGKDDYLDVETLIHTIPTLDSEAKLELYMMDSDLQEEIVNSAEGYPSDLSQFPLDRCENQCDRVA